MRRFRIHFENAPDEVTIRPVWSSFLTSGARLGMLPTVMYKTGSSKKAAMKKPVVLTATVSVDMFLDKLFRPRRLLPQGFVADGIWAGEQEIGTEVQVVFHARTKTTGFELIERNPYMIILVIVSETFGAFNQLLRELRQGFPTDLIVFEFDGHRSHILRVSDADDIWIDRVAEPRRFETVARRVMPLDQKIP